MTKVNVSVFVSKNMSPPGTTATTSLLFTSPPFPMARIDDDSFECDGKNDAALLCGVDVMDTVQDDGYDFSAETSWLINVRLQSDWMKDHQPFITEPQRHTVSLSNLELFNFQTLQLAQTAKLFDMMPPLLFDEEDQDAEAEAEAEAESEVEQRSTTPFNFLLCATWTARRRRFAAARGRVGGAQRIVQVARVRAFGGAAQHQLDVCAPAFSVRGERHLRRALDAKRLDSLFWRYCPSSRSSCSTSAVLC